MSRNSFGGMVVCDSLAAVGLTEIGPRVSLVETTRQRHLDVVLVQNAWNVVDRATFQSLLKGYPARWRARARARRAIAQFNIRRAATVLCLTDALAMLVRNCADVSPLVTPVTLPLNNWRDPGPRRPTASDASALVVGTITWYKRPLLALEVVKTQFPQIRSIDYLGPVDGSGTWEAVQSRARQLGLEVRRQQVPHSAIYDAYAASHVTVLPSALESLGFAVAEAMLHAPHVIASDIPSHREVTRSLGMEPAWLTPDGRVTSPTAGTQGAVVPRRREVEAQWRRVADALQV